MKSLFRKALRPQQRTEPKFKPLLERSKVDWQRYATTLPPGIEDPIAFFLEHFYDYPVVEPEWFDSAYYLETNPDVEMDGANPLVHFLLYGKKEGRPAWPSPTLEPVAPAKAEQSPKPEAAVPPKPVAKPAQVQPAKPAQAQQEQPQQEPRKPEPEPPKPAEPPAEPAPAPPPVDAASGFNSVLKNRLRELLTSEKVPAAAAKGERLGPWLDELIQISEHGNAKIEGFFDQKFYESIYPDIRNAPINAFHHFIMHGFKEGRAGCLDIQELLTQGGVAKQEGLETLLVVSHEASATGAPIVALEVARRFAGRFNVITAVLRGGELRERFIEVGTLHLDAPAHNGIAALELSLKYLMDHHDLKTVLLNSVESINMADAAANLGLPTLSLLHEFAEYTRPVGKIGRMLLTSDVIIYPAESLARSGIHELKTKAGIKHELNNIRIQPQGYLGFQAHVDKDWSLRKLLGLDEKAIVIAGAGHVQPRKGVDWFLETCYHLYCTLQMKGDSRAEHLQFVWLGNGYSEDDVLVSVWLDAFIQRVGISERVHFPGAVHDVAAALRDVDIYLLTSRLDPFPNVAIDALNADCGLGVFEEGSGVADFVKEHAARAVIGKYGNPHHLAQLLSENLGTLMTRDGKNIELCHQQLDFDRYIDALQDALVEANQRSSEVHKVAETERFKLKFDPTFYGLNFSTDGDKATHFLSLLRKGVALSKPFPGCDIQRALDAYHQQPTRFEALVESVMGSEDPAMPVHRVTGAGTDDAPDTIALQFHVYFADLIPDYCAYFKNLADQNVDLFVSHIPDLTPEQLELLQSSITGTVYTQKVANCGRDVYPFHRLFVEKIYGHYEVVGHFHTKKSTDNADGVGDRWRRYLLTNLMGSRSAANEVMGQFADKRVGLVFAEDSHMVDEADNGKWIEELLEPLGYSRWPAYRCFPLGTMFWARAEALRDLTRWDPETFKLPEPVPYDGSVLHAFERVIPQLVQETGYRAQRVYTSNTHW
ncbi:rhamnan synthesis F family protein [Vreelandella glaciei]|uniref:rhamnan synthesis F family protein n=1 Tax=Vreelandella glaciei TaxID=186761 RepID=UPI0015D02A87|nr:rhamnan synthesis F family protein [Halomonas glaciei]